MQQFVQIIASGFVGFIGGAAALWTQQRFAWLPQKRIELRRAVFDEAMNALARYQIDALDVKLQKAVEATGAQQPYVELRPETKVTMERARLQVHAFFPVATFEAFTRALNADVRINNIPNADFTEKSSTALKLMATDIGLW